MSEEKRNISDINDQKTAEQQAFSEEIRRRLAEPDSGKPTLEEFKLLVYKDREKRRKKRNTLIACIVAAFIVGFLSFDALVPEVGADKNPKETIVTEDGVIIEDGGYGSSEEADNVWVTEDWKQVLDGKMVTAKLLIPKYLPPGYKFKKLLIENLSENSTICHYYFEKANKEELEIEILFAKGENTATIEGLYDIKNSSKGEIYIQKKERKATMFLQDGIISIWANIEDEEFVKIIEGLSN